MKKILFFLFIFNSFNIIGAQNNSLYFELLGPGLTYSFNYERSVYNNIALRVGMGNFTLTEDNSFGELSITPIIIGANYMAGRKWRIEAGLGISYWLMEIDGLVDFSDFDFNESTQQDILNYYVNLGLRYQNPKGGIMFKFGFSPTIISNFDDQSGMIPLPYLSMGYSF